MKTLNDYSETCYLNALTQGWWPKEVRDNPMVVPLKLCLVHSEISEAMEGHRKNLPDAHLPHRPMIEVELADALIRIFDLAGFLGLDLEGAVEEKMDYNKSRKDHKIEAREVEGGKRY
jgi:NTP pyrophosphatase (non-canonical NTP hydrolase)